MSQTDRSYLTRRLAGVDQALGEGSARRPVELLDQLRERLDRLDSNHPSANPVSADLDDAEAAQDSDPDCHSVRKEGADHSPGDQAGDEEAGQPPADPQPGQPVQPAAAVDGVAAVLADDGDYGMVETRLMANSEPYRPWFAGEPDAPWFVDPWFAE
jgi:hypothetical protein